MHKWAPMDRLIDIRCVLHAFHNTTLRRMLDTARDMRYQTKTDAVRSGRRCAPNKDDGCIISCPCASNMYHHLGATRCLWLQNPHSDGPKHPRINKDEIRSQPSHVLHRLHALFVYYTVHYLTLPVVSQPHPNPPWIGPGNRFHDRQLVWQDWFAVQWPTV